MPFPFSLAPRFSVSVLHSRLSKLCSRLRGSADKHLAVGEQLLCKIRDKDSKKIIQESIKKEKENLINDLSTKKDVKIFVEHTYNTYIAGRNLSLGFNLQCNKKHNNNKKYIPRVNQLIQYINPVLNNKSYKMATYRYVESPFCEDFKFDLSQEDEIEEKNENEKNKENDEFIDMIDNVEDELLFYDEKLGKNEDPQNTNEWSKKFTKDEFLIDFFNLKYRKKHIIAEVNDLFFSLQENKIMKKEMNSYLINSAKTYDEISKQEHYHEFKHSERQHSRTRFPGRYGSDLNRIR